MSVLYTDLPLYKSLNPNLSLTTSPIGGGVDTAHQITGGSLSELFVPEITPAASGSDIFQVANCFFANNNSATDLLLAEVFNINSLDVVTSNGTPTLVSDSTSDDTSVKVHLVGADAAGNPVFSDIQLNGTTPVTSGQTFSRIDGAVLQDYTAGTTKYSGAVGNIKITIGSQVVGYIPEPTTDFATNTVIQVWWSATGEIDFWLETTLNTSTTTTNPITLPTGFSGSRPRTPGSGLAVANTQILSHAGNYQSIWVKWSIKAGSLAMADMQVGLTLQGGTT